MSRTIVEGVILAVAILILGLTVLALKLKTGRSFRTLMAERPQLFDYSLKITLAILLALWIVAMVVNN